MSDKHVDIFNAILDGLGDLFYCILMAVQGKVGNTWGIYLNKDTMESFIKLAGHLSGPGRSRRLMQLLMTNLSGVQVIELGGILSRRLGDMTGDTPSEIRTSTTSALEWVRGVEPPPYSLLYLARHAINVARSGGSLPSAAILEIPECLRQYLLYK